MALVNSVRLAESQRAIQIALRAGQETGVDQNLSELSMVSPGSMLTTEFNLGLSYVDSNAQSEEAAKKKDLQTHAETPDAGAAQAQGEKIYPQAIALLQNKMIEASLYAATDPQMQQSILIDGLRKAQGLIKTCLKDLNGAEIPAEVAGYIAALGKIHNQMIQELSGISADGQNPAHADHVRECQTSAENSPFRV